jgi:DNA-binding winged helix-turn-helix (wHTH) protein
MNKEPGKIYRFGPFRYDSAQRLLFKGDELVQLVPKAVDTLQVLLELQGQVVGKAELMKAVWPDCVVEEIGLARNISLLRKSLGDEAESYIETVPKRGYRFTADVADLASGHAQATGQDPMLLRWRLRRPRPTWLISGIALVLLGAVVYWQFYRPSRFPSPSHRSRQLGGCSRSLP